MTKVRLAAEPVVVSAGGSVVVVVVVGLHDLHLHW